MRRAFRALALALPVAACCATAASAAEVTVVNRVNAIGLVDYRHKPDFKVGDYVRYRVVSGSDVGNQRSEYLLTVLIAGEEEFWGEKCFWVETWTDDADGKKSVVASLMSYDIFNDSLPEDRLQFFRRKVMSGFDENGRPIEELMRSSANLGSMRATPGRTFGSKIDTLAVDTVLTPVGTFRGRHVEILSGKSATRNDGDSTVYLENLEHQSRWVSPEVPITHISREDSRNTMGRQAWKIGYSRDSGPMVIRETAYSAARVIEIGHGLMSRILPKERATSFAQQAAARRGAAAKPRPRR